MFLVRHGESEFNQAFRKTRRDPGIIDPPLTFLGIQQIQQTADFFRDKDIQFCVSSPYPVSYTHLTLPTIYSV